MQTVADRKSQQGAKLLANIAVLLGDAKRLRDLNLDSDELFIAGPHFCFPELSLDLKRLQSRLRKDYEHFSATARALLTGQSDTVLLEINGCDETIRDIIDQNNVWYSTSEAAMAAAREAVNKILTTISSLYDSNEGSVVLVPDTNALIRTPVIHTWHFDEFPKFEILLVPTTLLELDKLKIEHRNPTVRKKAESIIRQVKEYRRRGPLSEGVTVVSDTIRLRSVALEPQVKDALPWLDADSRDDRILASFIEAMRAHPRSVVALVTGDINLQNKAEFARLPFIEPPNPPATQTKKR